MSTVLERGDLFFFYRPRIEPDSTRRFRRLVVGRKHLPEPETHERVWAFVADVADRPEELRDEIEPKRYETKNRGTRVQPEARPAGEAWYAIVDHDGHTHLAYARELPTEPLEQGKWR